MALVPVCVLFDNVSNVRLDAVVIEFVAAHSRVKQLFGWQFEVFLGNNLFVELNMPSAKIFIQSHLKILDFLYKNIERNIHWPP